MCTQHFSALRQGLLGFPMTLHRRISDSSLMKIDVSSELFLFYLALKQSLFIKEQGDKKLFLPYSGAVFYLRNIKQTYRDQIESNKHNQNHPVVQFCLHIKEHKKEKRFVHLEIGC